jgi:hypothetical protein
MNLYDLNKSIMQQAPKSTAEYIEAGKSHITKLKEKHCNGCYMLLNHEMRYFTLFRINAIGKDLMTMEDEAVACVQDMGYILSMDLLDEDDAVEIWVEPYDEEHFKAPVVFYLFPYDRGIVQCK